MESSPGEHHLKPKGAHNKADSWVDNQYGGYDFRAFNNGKEIWSSKFDPDMDGDVGEDKKNRADKIEIFNRWER